MRLLQGMMDSLSASPVASQMLCLPAEGIINHLLQYDQAALAQLHQHNGRLLCLKADRLGPVYLRLHSQGISLSLQNDALPDVTLSGTVLDFLQLASAGNKPDQLINSQIDMDGDTELALAISTVAQNLDIDWEALIQPVTGGLLAHQLGRGVRSTLHWGKSTTATYKTAAKEYLEDEVQLLATRTMVDSFNNEVDQLRLACDRLDARVAQRLKKYTPADQATPLAATDTDLNKPL